MNYRPIIESAYNRSDWQGLLHDIFGRRVDFYSPAHRLDVGKALIRQAWFLGAITLADGQKIGIYEAELVDGVELERNRVTVRNLLAQEWRGAGFAGAFQFCYKAGSSTLRFSYASETWSFDKDGNFRKESTDTRRFTYFLGEGHRSRTALQQFQELKKSDLTLADITRAFSVEAVSARFFADYKRNYEDIVEYVTGKRMVKSGGKWQEKETGKGDRRILSGFSAFENPEKAVRDYVKKLMGRLVFLQFIQKKGWLGVPKGRAWGEGDREFLQHLFDDHASSTFIDDVLEPLFDDINTRRKGDLANAKLGRNLLVPYLNGGLFEPDGADAADFPLPPEYLRALFDFFGSYNFTIDENDPEDAEVGVDPEMLSRIFENLLEDNKDKGAFYTPKSIVEYMCRESLTAYLQTDRPDAERPLVASFVRTHDAAPLAQNLRTEMLKRLEDVKICDPAIGSGAFPMGLLKELFACRAALGDPCAAHPAELKRRIIESNIYGVDIEKGAVDIARLRFWLALVVDEETPHALPNLDFKIMQGNSLLESFGGVPLDHVLEGGSAAVYKSGKKAGQKRSGYWQATFAFDAQTALDEIVRDKTALFNETDHEVKKELIKRINKNVKAFISNKLDPKSPYQSQIPDGQNDQFFLWHTWFSDVFDRPGKRGFDIVIGNPPYGIVNKRQNKGVSIVVSESAFDYYKTSEIYSEARGKGMLNIFRLFIQLSLNLLATDGIFTEIFPLAFAGDLSACALRKWVFDYYRPISFDAFPARDDPSTRVFASAKMSVCIMSVRKSRPGGLFQMQINPTKEIGQNSSAFMLSREKMLVIDPVYYRLPIASAVDYDILYKMQKSADPLSKIASCAAGEMDMTLCKAAFTTNSAFPEMIRGAGIGRYVVRERLSQGEHLYIDESKMTKDVVRMQKLLHSTRIAMQAISGVEEKWRIKATKINGMYCANSTNYISLKDEDTDFVLALLNSRLMNFFFSRFSTNSNVNGYEVDLLPLIFSPEKPSRCDVNRMVREILTAKKANPEADTSELEAEIDALVYKLYGLTDEEIAVVEGRKN